MAVAPGHIGHLPVAEVDRRPGGAAAGEPGRFGKRVFDQPGVGAAALEKCGIGEHDGLRRAGESGRAHADRGALSAGQAEFRADAVGIVSVAAAGSFEPLDVRGKGRAAAHPGAGAGSAQVGGQRPPGAVKRLPAAASAVPADGVGVFDVRGGGHKPAVVSGIGQVGGGQRPQVRPAGGRLRGGLRRRPAAGRQRRQQPRRRDGRQQLDHRKPSPPREGTRGLRIFHGVENPAEAGQAFFP